MDDLMELERLYEKVNNHYYKRNPNALSRTQGKILKILSKEKSMTQKELQEKLQVQPGTISEMISKMVKKGLVVKVRDEKDNRRMIISITDKGLEDVLHHHERYVQRVASSFEVLDETERQQFKKILLKILGGQDGNEGE